VANLPSETTTAELSDEAFAGLERQSFWRHFHTLTTIARPSRREELVSGPVSRRDLGPAFAESRASSAAVFAAISPLL
jgi:hypothetical protein